MWKVLRFMTGVVLLVSLGAMLVAVREHPRGFEPRHWRPYVDRRSERPWETTPSSLAIADADLRPFGAWSSESSMVLCLLHLGVTVTLALRAALRWRALRALQRHHGEGPQAPYRREAAQAPRDPRLVGATRDARVEALVLAAAAVLPCVTTMREVIVLRTAGVVVHATPTAIGWYQEVMRNGDGGREHHGVRAQARVEGCAVALEAPCGLVLAQRLDAGSVGGEGIPFVVWRAFPSVHQIGTAPVLGPMAGWAHLAFLAALAWEGLWRRSPGRALAAPSKGPRPMDDSTP